MTPGRTRQTIIRGSDFVLGFRRTENDAPCDLSGDTFAASLRNAAGTQIAVPSVDYIDAVTRRIFISHAITNTLPAGQATLTVQATRTVDGFTYQLLTGQITIL
jgi:hypothetical protein